jgi:ATP diphosphatase
VALDDRSENGGMARLLAIMTRLRDRERGCPWDLEQTFATIAPYTIEEAHEVADAIERRDYGALKGELGDLLLQVVFHAQMATEAGLFDFAAVADAICDKLIRRHPHVFGEAATGDGRARDVHEQTAHWERLKADERRAGTEDGAATSALDGIPPSLPALRRALKIQTRAAASGFDWPDATAALAKFEEEAQELGREIADGADPERLADELGDLLFTAVNVARKLRIDPEAALKGSCAKFERRFRAVEALAGDGGLPASDPAALDRLWERVKAGES